MKTLFFQDYDRPGTHPPQGTVPMLQPGERIVSVETVKFGLYGTAVRVWIERDSEATV